MPIKAEASAVTDSVEFTLNGAPVRAEPGETVWQVARRHGHEIPHLCLSTAPEFSPNGNCRLCMVEIVGRPYLAASCMTRPEAGIEVLTQSGRARATRRGVMELLLAEAAIGSGSEAGRWKRAIGLEGTRYAASGGISRDDSNPGIAVNLAACIRCLRCLQACRGIEIHEVIGMAHRGAGSTIVFDFADEMASSRCVSCGSCAQACPTGAVFMPFCFAEAAANLLTNFALDPQSKIPEYKYCAVRLETAIAT